MPQGPRDHDPALGRGVVDGLPSKRGIDRCGWALCGADELLGEKEKYKTISEDLDFTFTELAGF